MGHSGNGETRNHHTGTRSPGIPGATDLSCLRRRLRATGPLTPTPIRPVFVIAGAEDYLARTHPNRHGTMRYSGSLTRATLVLAILALFLPAGATGQEVLPKLQDDFRRLRGNVLGMVDAMPAEGLRSSPTDGVRDFAQQIEHIAIGAVNIIASGVDADRIPLGMDPDNYLNDKDALKAFVNTAFDRVDRMLAEMTPEDLVATGSLFGQLERPRWMILEAAYEHGVWTLGATVPYLRLAGSAPPGYNLVPGAGGN